MSKTRPEWSEEIARRTDDLHALLGVDDHADALAEQLLVVDEEHADVTHRALTGTHAVAVKVGPSGSTRRRTSRRPPTESSRRRIPSRP